MPIAGHLRDDGPPPLAARQGGAVESDDDEGAIRLSYTLNLHLMQLPGTFLKKTKCLGQVMHVRVCAHGWVSERVAAGVKRQAGPSAMFVCAAAGRRRVSGAHSCTRNGAEYTVTQVTFEAMELFEDEDSESRHIPNALGMLNTNALTLVLTRIQRRVGFACTGFEYTGYPSTNSQKYSI